MHLDRRLEVSDFHDHFLYIQQLFFSHWAYEDSVPGPEDGMDFAIGPIHLLLLAASLWVSWRTASGLWQGGFQEESNLRTRERLDRLANLVQHMKPVVEPDEPIEEQDAWIFARMASAFTYELRRTGPPS